jgi:phage repressor protein C with HTH and peptisase S24 domain
MFTHRQVWQALDTIAKRNGMSISALARKSGLDATSFNQSKRVGPTGRPRWPSTESIAKVLEVTGTPMSDFTSLVQGGSATGRPEITIPLVGLAQAGKGGYFDDAGFPVGSGWDGVGFPSVKDENAYALEVTGDSMEPVYRDGDVIIVSPAAPVRRGDRVVVKTKNGEVMVKELKRQTAKQIELKSLNADHPERTLSLEDVVWIARIVWASQ